jgi:hypothetical protein
MMNPLAGPAGPGKYSTRTDNLQMGSTAYGEGVETAAINAGAPKSRTRGIADNVGGRPVSTVNVPQGEVTSLYAPSQRPDEPVTAGVDIGPGPGSQASMMQSQFANRKMSDILAEMIPYDTTGEIQYLYQNALSRGN